MFEKLGTFLDKVQIILIFNFSVACWDIVLALYENTSWCLYISNKSTFVQRNRVVFVSPYSYTHNMRILFHKAHLYKSIRFIFTCGKGLYSQSEWRTAISHVEV